MNEWTVFAGLLAVCVGTTGFRPPAVPLVQNDPFFSVWSAADRLTDADTTHWSGAKQPISIVLECGGRAWRLCGAEPKGVAALPQVSTRVGATRTVCEFANGAIRARLAFSTDKTADDIERFSRPVTYVTLGVEGVEGWSAKLSITGAMATNDDKAEMAEERLTVAGLPAVRIGRKVQTPLSEVGDKVRCNWGYAWAVGPKMTGKECHWILAYDDLAGLQFLGRCCPAWWRRNGQTFKAMLEAAERDYDGTVARLERYDREIDRRLEDVGGRQYADIATLAYRQSFSACNVVAGKDGTMLMFSKENDSNGCMGTVDLIYPQLPHLLFAGPTLVRAALNPIMIYASSDEWPYPYAPHDVGRYPIGDGQCYGMKAGQSAGGKDDDALRMPVEECGNMIIALAALSRLEGNADYVSQWWPMVAKWAEYLENTGFDPGSQLCTDDFAGRLAHNVNLSAKSVVAIGAFALMAEMRGEKAVAAKYRALAAEMVPKWIEKARGGREGATKIAFTEKSQQGADTWSQKYNLVWDRLLGLGLFPLEIGAYECAAYRKLALPYGIPLDCRRTYTKADWLVWSATLSGDRDDFEAIIAPLHRFLDETQDRIPFTDWYWADTGRHKRFIARSVVGAMFLPALYGWKCFGECGFDLLWSRRFVFDAEREMPEGVSYLPAARYSATVTTLPAEMRFVEDGETVARFAAPTNVEPPYAMHLMVNGAHRPSIFVTKDGETSLAAIADWPTRFEPRSASLTNTLRFAVSDGMREPKVSLSAGIGQADTRFVTRGRTNAPYVEDGRLFFTFSARAYGAYLGVMSFGPDKCDFRLEGVILFDCGDGLLRNDLAADLFYDDAADEWRAYVSNFSTGADSLVGRAKGGVNAAWSKECPLHGVSVMRARSLGLDGMNEDPDGYWDAEAGKWRLLVSEFTAKGIRATLLESERWDGPFRRLAGPVAEDSTGTTLAVVDGRLRALAGSANRAFHIYDYPTLEKVGKLNVTNPTWRISSSDNGRSWPAYVELPDGQRLLLTFDRVNFAGMPTPNWTYGGLYLYRWRR